MFPGTGIMVRVIIGAVAQPSPVSPSSTTMSAVAYMKISLVPAYPPIYGISAALHVSRTIWVSLGILNLSIAAAMAFWVHVSQTQYPACPRSGPTHIIRRREGHERLATSGPGV